MATIVTKPTINKIRIAETDINRLELPEGYRLVREKTKAERVKELEGERDKLLQSKPPDDKALIEFAKLVHPYYTELQRIEIDIKELS